MRQRPTQKASILNAAINLAQSKPYHQLSRSDIARAVGCSSALVSYLFESMDLLREEIVATALERKILLIIGQAILQRNPAALNAPQKLRTAAIVELSRQ